MTEKLRCLSKHLSGASKPDNAALLLDCQRREEDRYQSVLSPGQALRRMAGDLEKKLPIPSLVKELPERRFLYRQPAQDEGPRSEPKVLVRLLPFQPDASYGLRPPRVLLRDNQIARYLAQDVSCGTESARMFLLQNLTSRGPPSFAASVKARSSGPIDRELWQNPSHYLR